MKELLEEYKNISEQMCKLFEIDYKIINIQLNSKWRFADNNIEAVITYNKFDVYDDFIEYDKIYYKNDFVLIVPDDNNSIVIIFDKNKQIKE